jgi:acyl dehydratase
MQDKAPPRFDLLHFEDVVVGQTVPFGRKQVTKEEIVAFASAYDPQLIHLDEEVAKASIVGGLCASGFHSCAILMRMLADDVLNKATSLGSPGMDEVKWLKPVRPGDKLTARYTCTSKRVLGSRPNVGLAAVTFEMLNQAGDVVMIWMSNQLLAVRHPGGAAATSPPSGSAKTGTVLQNLWDLPVGPAPSLRSNYFEDRVVGENAELGSHTFTKPEIIAFAREYDPQPFHLDEEAAKKTILGGLAASGWHTAAISMRLAAEARPFGPHPLFGAGVDDLRWLKPVRPGDTIHLEGEVVELVPSRTKPQGIARVRWTAYNQHGEAAYTFNPISIVPSRPK